MDGNAAAGDVAYRLSEVVAIYPITPASPMGEMADHLASRGTPNLWGDVPKVVEMQSEAGAAGTLHGALQAGALATTFTASQGLLLMLPNMFKIAGELTPAVIHVAARAVATHALSIFGDHSDVMAARPTGWAILHATSVQEAHDMALVAHAATLRTRVPFVHVIDGFRTSHELNGVEVLEDDALRALVTDDLIAAHRDRALDPARPVVRGTAQNPDVFFQSREATNSTYAAVTPEVSAVLDELAGLCGRRYRTVEYDGPPDATEVVVISGSGVWAARAASERLQSEGRRCGVVNLRLFHPFPAEELAATLPPTVERVAVLDRCKEPGAAGEPLLLEVTSALVGAVQRGQRVRLPHLVGGRYGLGSKEFTPAMAAAVFDELATAHHTAATPGRQRFTVGIDDDLTGLSLPVAADRVTDTAGTRSAVLVGLGSDGTVGAAKNACHIVAEQRGEHAQGYFVYDSKKSGAVTVSHLRFSDGPIEAPWLIRHADYVGVHQFSLLERHDLLASAAPGATVVINSPFGPTLTWDRLPTEAREQILRNRLEVHVIDAATLSREVGLGGIVSTVMLTCFVELAGLLPVEEAADAIKEAIAHDYAKLGDAVLRPNHRAVDASLERLARLEIPADADQLAPAERPSLVPADAPEFVQRVTAELMAGRGDRLAVSALPIDGTFPVGTARYEKRGIAATVPEWVPELCIDCAKCAAICPHAAVRLKVYDEHLLEGAPPSWRSKPSKFFEAEDPQGGERPMALTVQVFTEDCTGCGLCVEVCPAQSKEQVRRKALNMVERADDDRSGVDFFLGLPADPPPDADPLTTRGVQLREPLFEFSGACAGCGETPYLKLLTQVCGDHMVVANATGCSSIYGGNLPTTPWAAGADGRGPAWSNSLFEDNAEFGLGLRLALDRRHATALRLVAQLAEAGLVPERLAAELAEPAPFPGPVDAELDRTRQDALIEELRHLLESRDEPAARQVLARSEDLRRTVVWIVGGDGWAYDIGFGGLDHVLASGHDVNVLVMDTEGYSNTGGQASKATFRSAVAKFASSGKEQRKKDLGMLAAGYGSVYVAQIAIGANDLQAVRAVQQAVSYPGPSLVLAYSHCITHGIDMRLGAHHQQMAVRSGYWPLWRYDPRHAHRGDHPLRLDSRAPSVSFADFARTQARFTLLERANPAAAAHLFALAQHDIDERWHLYEQMGEMERWADDEVHDEIPVAVAGSGEDRASQEVQP
jgi:pyruvate-ferredoxin/flavodoxin oxidoreductase